MRRLELEVFDSERAQIVAGVFFSKQPTRRKEMSPPTTSKDQDKFRTDGWRFPPAFLPLMLGRS